MSWTFPLAHHKETTEIPVARPSAMLNTIFFILLLTCSVMTQAQPAKEPGPVPDSLENQLLHLYESIQSTRSSLEKIEKKISRTGDDLQRRELEAEKAQLAARLSGLLRSFEQVAVSGVDLERFSSEPSPGFNWRKDLQDILDPILSELKRFTERPRAIERLRTQRTELQSRIYMAVEATQQLAVLIEQVESPEIKKLLVKLDRKWRERLNDLVTQLQLVEFQLQEKLAPEDEFAARSIEQIRNFITGRGLNILLAASAFAVTFLLLTFLGKFFSGRLYRSRQKEKRFWARLLSITFRAFTGILALLSAMAVLYYRGDWFILGLLVIFLVAASWTVRRSLPKFIGEARILLNLGSVREKERVFYRGLPFRVESLNLFTTLNNPALVGGKLHVPIETIRTLESRKYSKDEPWFPTKINDYVILDDSTFGRVTLQTPEVVTLEVLGGSTKTYRTVDFIDQRPRNLSHGFGLLITFGVDYCLQAAITRDIPRQMQEFITEHLSQEPFAAFHLDTQVEFKSAGSSALELILLSKFSGQAAPHYWSISRFLQRTAVDACNTHNWNIPFTQLTLHFPK